MTFTNDHLTVPAEASTDHADSTERPDLMVTGWTRRGDRLDELADELGGRAEVIFTPRLTARALIPIRYLVCALWTVVALLRHRPRRVIVVNPPLWPAVLIWSYASLTGARWYLDSHPGGFGAQGHELERRLQPLHRFLIRRADGVLVASRPWADVVESLGTPAVVVHEPPRPRGRAERREPTERAVALFVGVFAPDEPYDAVVEAARLRPEVDWHLTGDPDRAPAGLVDTAPSNVEFTGYLGPDDFDAALAGADVVIALTTEPTSVMRAGFEAVDSGTALVVSDHPIVVDAFPAAAATPNEARGIATAVADLLTDPEATRRRVAAGRRHHADQWLAQRDALIALVEERR